MTSTRIITLNIGGSKYTTTHATLTKYPDTFFTAMLSEHISTTKDAEGCYFIDRDGQFFAPILTWLRTNEISYPRSKMTKDDLLREAIFYSIQPLVDILSESDTSCGDRDEDLNLSLDCPPDIKRYVTDYWSRHEKTIMSILRSLNKEGAMNVTAQIVPGHRQDIERPPQLLPSGRVGLYMNFTYLHISKYAHVQCLLATCFKKNGCHGYFKPGEYIELWWDHEGLTRKNELIHF